MLERGDRECGAARQKVHDGHANNVTFTSAGRREFMETRTQWFGRMAARLRLILQCPEKPVSQDDALSLIVAMVGLRDVTEVVNQDWLCDHV